MAGTPHVSGTVVPSADLNDRVKIYDRATSTIDVVSSVTETVVYTKSIGAGHMSTDRVLRLNIYGDILANTGGSINYTLRCKFGGTTWYSATKGTTNDPDRYAVDVQVTIANLASASSQFASGVLLEGSVTAPTTGISSVDPVGRAANVFGSNGLLTINTALAQTLEVSVQWDTNSASASWRRRHAILELM